MSFDSERAGEETPGSLAWSCAQLRTALGTAEAEVARLRAILALYAVDPDAKYAGAALAHRALLAVQALVANGILMDPAYADVWPRLRLAIDELGPETALRATQSAEQAPVVPEATPEASGSPERALDEPGPSARDEARGAFIEAILHLLPIGSDVGEIARLGVDAVWRYAGSAAIRETAAVIRVVPIPPLSQITRDRFSEWMLEASERYFREA